MGAASANRDCEVLAWNRLFQRVMPSWVEPVTLMPACLCCKLLIDGWVLWGEIGWVWCVPIGAWTVSSRNVALPAPGTTVHTQRADRRLGDDGWLPAG